MDSNTRRSSESSLIRLRKRILSLGSSPAVGSSSIKILGLFNIACAIPARLFIPPDNFFNFLFATFASPTLEINSFVLFLATAGRTPLIVAM